MKETERKSLDGIFASLAQLPLLKGASAAHLHDIVGRMKLHFFKVNEGDVIVRQGDACESLLFVLSGSVRLLTQSPDGSLTVGQTLDAPRVIAPDCLFGLLTQYPCDAVALTPAGLMEISKEDYRAILGMDPVFLFNYLNLVCASSQRARKELLAVDENMARHKLSYWINTLTQPGARDVTLQSRGRPLSQLLGVPAQSLRAALRQLAPDATLDDDRTLRL